MKGRTKFNMKTKERDPERAIRVQRTAEICGVSTRTVYRVIQGEQMNEEVVRIYIHLTEGENELLKAVKDLVPIF